MNVIKKITLTIVALSFIGLALYGFARILFISFEKNEIVSCTKLQGYAEEFSHTFYITKWQNEMCLSHNIQINAPVHQ